MYYLEFTIADLPPLPNASRYTSWRKQSSVQKLWRGMSKSKAQESGVPIRPLERATLTLVRYSSSEPDYDGLVYSFKPVIDGLKDAGIIKDDRRSVIGVPAYEWRRVRGKLGYIRVTVASCPPPTCAKVNIR